MMRNGEFSTQRSRDAHTIAKLLDHHYYDAPICFFSPVLVSAASKWLATLNSAFVITTMHKDTVVGFVLAQMVGPGFWRQFAIDHFYLAPWFAAYAVARRRNARRGDPDNWPNIGPTAEPDRAAAADMLISDAPFAWSPSGSGTGYVELLHVSEGYRGRGLARSLLRTLAQEMQAAGARRVEAHIDAANYRSVAAFQGAAWHVERTSSNDFLAFVSLTNEQ